MTYFTESVGGQGSLLLQGRTPCDLFPPPRILRIARVRIATRGAMNRMPTTLRRPSMREHRRRGCRNLIPSELTPTAWSKQRWQPLQPRHHKLRWPLRSPWPFLWLRRSPQRESWWSAAPFPTARAQERTSARHGRLLMCRTRPARWWDRSSMAALERSCRPTA